MCVAYLHFVLLTCIISGQSLLRKPINITRNDAPCTGDLHCHLFYLDDNNVLKRFQTFDQLSDYLVSAALDRSSTSAELQWVCNNLLQLPFVTANHYASVGEYLKCLYEKDRLMDVLIDVRGTKFRAHRIALCCHSDYFADLFNRKVITKVPFELKVNGICPEAFATFLEFCYTGDIHVTPEIATEVLIVVDFLKVGSLKRRMGVVYDNIPLDQALKLLTLSKDRVGELFKSMFLRVLRNFSEASRLNGFWDLDATLFCHFLESGK